MPRPYHGGAPPRRDRQARSACRHGACGQRHACAGGAHQSVDDRVARGSAADRAPSVELVDVKLGVERLDAHGAGGDGDPRGEAIAAPPVHHHAALPVRDDDVLLERRDRPVGLELRRRGHRGVGERRGGASVPSAHVRRSNLRGGDRSRQRGVVFRPARHREDLAVEDSCFTSLRRSRATYCAQV